MTLVSPERAERGTSAGKAPTCEAAWIFLGAELLCGDLAAGRFRRCCAHEHVRDGWLCRCHADTSELGGCRACYELPGDLSHECPIGITELTAGAS